MRLHLRRARSQDAPDEGRPCRRGNKRLNNKSGDHPAPRRKTERPPSSTAPAAFKSTARANDSRYLIAPNSISYFLFLDSVRAQFFAQRFVRGDVGIERPRTGGTVPRPLFYVALLASPSTQIYQPVGSRFAGDGSTPARWIIGGDGATRGVG